MVGSFDRHVHSDEPDRPDRPDAAADRPRSPRETEAQPAERLGLPNLTRAAAYESLYAKAQAQDAPFRERLAREEREESAGSPESLTESTGNPAPPIDKPAPPIDKPAPPIDKHAPPIDNPERDPEAPRTYWTEVPRFFATWQTPYGHMAGANGREVDSGTKWFIRRDPGDVPGRQISVGERISSSRAADKRQYQTN